MIWPIPKKEQPPAPPAPAVHISVEQYVELQKRLARIETRLCVLMSHHGLDPAQGHNRGYHPTQAGTPSVR